MTCPPLRVYTRLTYVKSEKSSSTQKHIILNFYQNVKSYFLQCSAVPFQQVGQKNILTFILFSCDNVSLMLGNLFMSQWSHKERVWLKSNYGKLSVMECATHLDRSPNAVRSQVKYLRKRGWVFNSTRR